MSSYKYGKEKAIKARDKVVQQQKMRDLDKLDPRGTYQLIVAEAAVKTGNIDEIKKLAFLYPWQAWKVVPVLADLPSIFEEPEPFLSGPHATCYVTATPSRGDIFLTPGDKLVAEVPGPAETPTRVESDLIAAQVVNSRRPERCKVCRMPAISNHLYCGCDLCEINPVHIWTQVL